MATASQNSSPNNTTSDDSKRLKSVAEASPKGPPVAAVTQPPLPTGSSDKSVSNQNSSKFENKDDDNNSVVGFKVGVWLGIFFLVVCCLVWVWLTKIKRRNPKHNSGGNPSLKKGGIFKYEDLVSATDGFAKDKIIGNGGFGRVYKGIMPDGKEVAVKRLKAGSQQGEREFQAEININRRIYHRNLAPVIGYCIRGEQRMLVYEYISNKTLEYHLHVNDKLTMDWNKRMKIAIGSAKGLAYLHEDCYPRIIHRDIKSSNVLVDDNFEPKLSDFGLAKLTTDSNTHVSTRVMGTFGYLDPEYVASGQPTEKSDVYSFGVMLLELITGKRPLDFTNDMGETFLNWAKPLLHQGLENNGDFGRLVDPVLENNYNSKEMARMGHCAAISIQQSAMRRPKMSQVVRALEKDIPPEDLKKGLMC